MPTRFPTEGNPYYPLPPDYTGLSLKGQRMARVNALRLQETPDDLVHAWSFLRNYYLRDDESDAFRPGWYKRYRESPPLHYNLIRSIGRYPYNSVAVPRSFAKSTVYMELAMLLFLTREYFNTLLIYSRGTLVNRRFSNNFQYQFEHNRRIVDDFGRLKPPMGKGTWNTQMLVNFQNRSILSGMVVKGSLLGERPDLILPDDCEHDPELQVSSTELIDNMDRLMHNVILPMQDDGGTAIAVLGTLFNQRCWLARWMHMREEDDPRVKYWNRVLYSAEDKNADGSLLWEEKFNQESLDRDKERLGPSAYAAQRLNKPGEGQESILRIDPLLGQYTVEGEDEFYALAGNSPLQSKAQLVSHKKVGDSVEEVRRSFGETVQRMFRVALVDYAKCDTPTSDFVCIMIIGLENSKAYKDTWWILDVFLKRIRGDALYRVLFDMSYRWRTHYVGIEAVGPQETVYNSAKSYITPKMEESGWKFRMFPITYPNGMSKEERIIGLEWRHHQDRVKYPKHLRGKSSAVRDLYLQVEGFTGEKGCLRYDDAVDTEAMASFLLRSRRSDVPDDLPAFHGYDPVDMLMRDEPRLPGGLPVGLALSPNKVPHELLERMVTRQYTEESEKRSMLWHPNSKRDHKTRARLQKVRRRSRR